MDEYHRHKRHHAYGRPTSGRKRPGDALESGRDIAALVDMLPSSGRKRAYSGAERSGSAKRGRATPPSTMRFAPGRAFSGRRGAGRDSPERGPRRLRPRQLFPGGGGDGEGASILAPPATDTALSALVAVLASVAAACVILVRHTRVTFACTTHGDVRESDDARAA